MTWTLVFIASLTIMVALLGAIRFKESKYLKKKTRDTLSPEVKAEIEKEKSDFIKRQKRFDKALVRAEQKLPK